MNEVLVEALKRALCCGQTEQDERLERRLAMPPFVFERFECVEMLVSHIG